MALLTEYLAKKLSRVLAGYKDISFRSLKIGKLIFFGPPRAGKTTLRKELLRYTVNIPQKCITPEPSTPIAEIGSPILITRLLAIEKDNKWSWTYQELDDIAKTLLQSLDIELSKNKIRPQDAQINNTREEKPLIPTPVSITECQDDGYNMTTTTTISISKQVKATVQNEEDEKMQVSHLAADTTGVHEKVSNSRVNLKNLFLEAIKYRDWSKVMDIAHILDNAILLQVIDGGGQPTFQEIFPLLINGSSLRLLIFKLTDNPKISYNAQYQPINGVEQTWPNSTYVVKDFISHAISSQFYLSTKSQSHPTLQFDSKSKLLLIGTHKDMLEGSEEDKMKEIKCKTKSLYQTLLDESKAFGPQVVDWLKKENVDDFITGIAKCDDKSIINVKRKIEEGIEELLSETLPDGIPGPWLVFDFAVHKYAELEGLDKVEKSKCHEIAKVCGIKEDEIDVILYFLHYKAGTLLYYSDIPELNSWVITNFQLILDSISEVIRQYFCDCSKPDRKTNMNGLVEMKNPCSFDNKCLKFDQLRSLMKHCHIISVISSDTFFMPSLLPQTELAYNVCNNSCSFLVMFEQGYCPIGFFCAVSTRLVNTHNWEINMSLSQFKNRMCFRYLWSETSYDIVFTAFNDYYEVCVNEINIPEVRFRVYKAVNKSFANVCNDLQYSLPSYGLYCTCGAAVEHMAKLEGDDYEEMKCHFTCKQIGLTRLQKSWFCKVCTHAFKMSFPAILWHYCILLRLD